MFKKVLFKILELFKKISKLIYFHHELDSYCKFHVEFHSLLRIHRHHMVHRPLHNFRLQSNQLLLERKVKHLAKHFCA